MIRLKIRNFSCLKSVDIEMSPMTVLIGPQASGKSVISKLMLFCQEIITKQLTFVYRRHSLDHFRAELSREFISWFPVAAWGNGQFSIELNIGPASIQIVRSGAKEDAKERASIQLSNYISSLYEGLLRTVNEKIADDAKLSEEADPRRSVEAFLAIRDAAERKMRGDFGEDYINYQIFIPAGRSFFTTTSKGFAAIEQGLDQVTARFGRFFTRIKETRPPAPSRGSARQRNNDRLLTMEKFFGGRVRMESDTDFVESTDGRKLPFNILSSGQQELLPLRELSYGKPTQS